LEQIKLTNFQLSDDLNYWRNNSYPIAFQNHHAAFIITGERIHINGYGTGGINGSGNAWYNAEHATTLPGRPMPFVFWNVSDIFVEHCKPSLCPNRKSVAKYPSLCQRSSTMVDKYYEWHQHLVR
jgi:hypothetical protein